MPDTAMKSRHHYRSWDCHAKSRLLSTLRSIRPCTTSRLWTSMVMRVMIFERDSLVNLQQQGPCGNSGGEGKLRCLLQDPYLQT